MVRRSPHDTNEDPHSSALRSQMLMEGAAHASVLFEQTGRPGLETRVVQAMRKVPRHEFVPVELKLYAYLNQPLPSATTTSRSGWATASRGGASTRLTTR